MECVYSLKNLSLKKVCGVILKKELHNTNCEDCEDINGRWVQIEASLELPGTLKADLRGIRSDMQASIIYWKRENYFPSDNTMKYLDFSMHGCVNSEETLRKWYWSLSPEFKLEQAKGYCLFRILSDYCLHDCMTDFWDYRDVGALADIVYKFWNDLEYGELSPRQLLMFYWLNVMQGREVDYGFRNQFSLFQNMLCHSISVINLPAVKYFLKQLSFNEFHNVRELVLQKLDIGLEDCCVTTHFELMVLIWDSFNNCPCCSYEILLAMLQLRRTKRKEYTWPSFYRFDRKVIGSLEAYKDVKDAEQLIGKSSPLYNGLLSLYTKYLQDTFNTRKDYNLRRVTDSARNVLLSFLDLFDERQRKALLASSDFESIEL